MCLFLGSILFRPMIIEASDSAFCNSLKPLINDICKKIPEGKAVIVVPFQDIQGNITSLGTYLSEQVQISLANKSVTVVERRALETALEEQKLTQSGLLDENTVVKLGRALGARIAIYGTAIETKKLIGLNLKIVDIEKGITIGGVTDDIERNRSMNQIINTFPDRWVDPKKYPESRERSSYSYSYKTKFSVGLSYLGTIPTDSQQFGNGMGGLATLLYDFGDYFDIEMCLGHYVEEIKQDKLPSGSIALTSVQGGLRFYFLGEGKVTPYVSAGLGLYSVSSQKHDGIDTGQINLCPEGKSPCPANLNSGVGAYGGVGVNIHLNTARTMTLSMDARYAPFTSNTGADTEPPPPSSTSFRLGGIMASTGFLYRY
jgi:outer membrane protein W/TolB-like protein